MLERLMLRPKPTAGTKLWNPRDDPMKTPLHFSPCILDGSTKVQGCEGSESRSKKGRSQDLNPGSLGPEATPTNTT